MSRSSHLKFDSSRAEEYGRQARIGLAGYDACHELCACILSAAIPDRKDALVLVVGAGGTGGEILAAAGLEPGWTFVAVDPSSAMLDLAKAQIEAAGIGSRVEFVCDLLSAVPEQAVFDAALVIGVLHHIPDDEGKAELLGEIASRLQPSAPLVLAGNWRRYESEPLLLAAWANRWRMNGADPAEVEAKMNKILHGAEPPASEEAVFALLADAGFETPLRFFSSLFWGAWLARRKTYES